VKFLLLCAMVSLCGAKYPLGHTMVKYPGPSQECLAKQEMVGLKPEMKEIVVELHNELRVEYDDENSKFGIFHDGMTDLEWNEELASIAQRWADQCVFGHDDNRATMDASTVGQYVYLGYSPVQVMGADEKTMNNMEVKVGTPTGGNDVVINLGDVHSRVTGVEKIGDATLKEILSALETELTLGSALKTALKDPSVEVRKDDLVVEFIPSFDVVEHVPCAVGGRTRRDLVVEVGVSGNCHDVVVDWGEVDLDVAIEENMDIEEMFANAGMDWNDIFINAGPFFDGSSFESKLGEHMRNMLGNPDIKDNILVDEVTQSGREFGDNTEVVEGGFNVDIGRIGEDVDIQADMGDVHLKVTVDHLFDKLMEQHSVFKAGTVGILNEKNSDLQKIKNVLLAGTVHEVTLGPKLADALEHPNINVKRGGLVVELMPRADVPHVPCVVERDGKDLVVDVGVLGDCLDLEIAIDLGEVNIDLMLEEHVNDLFIDLGAIGKGTKGVLNQENSDLDMMEEIIEATGIQMVKQNHRVDTSFSVNQITLNSGETNLDLSSLLSTAITSWFAESVPAGGRDHILVSSYKLTLADGSEVPQLLYADTSDIGCGLSVYLEPAYPDWYNVLFVCNYA